MANRVAVTGASGLVGAAICRRLAEQGVEVVRIVRRPSTNAHEIQWDPETGETDRSRWEGLDAVLHLAGENIATGRWTATKKERIRNSRVKGTQHLVRVLSEIDQPPATLVAASAIGYYGDRGDEELDEDSPPGTGFLAEVCREWEEASTAAEESGIRVVRLRIGVVLAREGGALRAMLRPFRMGLGGRVGSGRQWWSWVALDDLVEIAWTALQQTSLRGPVNAVAPQPVRNSEFTRELARALHRPAILPLPAFAVRLLMGEMGEELLLASTRVIPRRLAETGYSFHHAQLCDALASILRKPAATRET